MTHPLDIDRARPGGGRRHDRNGWTSMGWALGVLGVFLTPVPLVGVASWVLSPVGVAVSLVAVAVAVRNRRGRTAAVGAALLCSVGVVFAVLFADAGHLPAPPSSSAGPPERPALSTTPTPPANPIPPVAGSALPSEWSPGPRSDTAPASSSNAPTLSRKASSPSPIERSAP